MNATIYNPTPIPKCIYACKDDEAVVLEIYAVLLAMRTGIGIVLLVALILMFMLLILSLLIFPPI